MPLNSCPLASTPQVLRVQARPFICCKDISKIDEVTSIMSYATDTGMLLMMMIIRAFFSLLENSYLLLRAQVGCIFL